MAANVGQRVRVHYNLFTHLWSVTAMDGAERGRVIETASSFALVGCKFVVSETMRQRVLARKKRIVHAWVEGYVVPVELLPDNAIEVTYNPYRSGQFTRRDNHEAVTEISGCWFIGKKGYMR